MTLSHCVIVGRRFEGSFKKSVTNCPKRQSHITEDLNLQHHRCESLRSRMGCGKLTGDEKKIDYVSAGNLRLDLELRLYIFF